MLELVPRVASCSHHGLLLVGHGSSIEIVKDRGKRSEVRIFSSEGTNVYGIVSTTQGGVLVHGERSLAFVPEALLQNEAATDEDLPKTLRRSFHDQILAVRQVGDKIAVLFTCNSLNLFAIEIVENELKMTAEKTVQSEHTAVLLNALLLGDSWSDLYTIVGTVFGEILVSRPSQGPQILHKFLGHTGMIFGLHLVADRLFSISDDRSLRVWHFSTDLISLKEEEIVCEYGHSARPFSICSDENGSIYTAGIDQTVVKWRLDGSTLRVLARHPLNIGCVRSLVYHENYLYCGGENGGLIAFNPNPSQPKMGIIESCEDLRGFARLGDDLYTVNGRGNLLRNNEPLYRGHCLRFLVPSPPFCDQSSVIAYGDRNVVVFCEKDDPIEFTATDRILSAVSCSGFVFIYTIERKGFLMDLKSGKVAEMSAAKALDGIAKKKPFVSSSMVVIQENNRLLLFVGSVCGHILFSSLPDGSFEGVTEMKTSSQVNRHFHDQVLCLRYDSSQKIIVSLTKKGHMQFWTIDFDSDDVVPLRLMSSRPVSDVVDLEMPSCFVTRGDKEFIAGFHATDFHLLDAKTGLSVFRVPCGGGNRPWQFTTSSDGKNGTLEYIKKEKLIFHSDELTEFSVLCENLHKSQILFVHSLMKREGFEVICTGGTDTQMVFTRVDEKTGSWSPLRRIVESSGFHCVDSCQMDEDTVLMASGCGKGRLLIWRLAIEGLLARNECCLRETAAYNCEEETRIVDVRFHKNQLLAAAHGNGSIEVYEVIEERITVLHKIPPPDLSLFTKVRWVDVVGKSHLAAVSTSGFLRVWKVDKNVLEEKIKVRVGRCGIASLAISATSPPLFAAGLESGEVVCHKLQGDELISFPPAAYHCATVTHLEYSEERDETIKLFSTSLDCRLTTWTLDPREIRYEAARALSIWDPSSFVILRSNSRVICVGSGVQTIEI